MSSNSTSNGGGNPGNKPNGYSGNSHSGSAPSGGSGGGGAAGGSNGSWWGQIRDIKSHIANSFAGYAPGSSVQPDESTMENLILHHTRRQSVFSFPKLADGVDSSSSMGRMLSRSESSGTISSNVNEDRGLLYGDVVLEGWLSKQTVLKFGVSNNSRWQNRYCSARRGLFSYYQVSCEDAVQLQSTQCTVEPLGSYPERLGESASRLGYRFLLRVPVEAFLGHSVGPLVVSGKGNPKQTFLIDQFPLDSDMVLLKWATNSEQEMLRWVQALSKCIGGADPSKESPASSGQDQSNAVQEFAGPEQHRGEEPLDTVHGTLMFESRSGSWEQAFVRLNSTKVLEIQVRSRLGVFPLSFCEIYSLNDGHANAFAIHSLHLDKELRLFAPSADECQRWKSVLTAIITQLQSNRLLGEARMLANLSLDALDFVYYLRDIISEDRARIVGEVKEWRDRLRNSDRAESLADGAVPPVLRILSLDGGGVRGVLNCVILERLCKRVPGLLKNVHFFAGTSNGGMLAAGLAFGYGPEKIRMLMEAGTQDLMRKRSGPTASVTRSKFSSEPMSLLCSETVGGFRLCDSQRYLLLPSYLLDNCASVAEERRGECCYYHNLPLKSGDHRPSMFEDVGDLIMRSTAAPTYFSSHQRHVDGGFFAQNPASSAMALAMDPLYLGLPAQRIHLLSLGTGRVNHHWPDETHDWGMIHWLPHLATILWDGMEDHTNFICRSVLGENFFRFQPILGEEIPLDDPIAIATLVRVAMEVDIDDLVRWTEQNFLAEDE